MGYHLTTTDSVPSRTRSLVAQLLRESYSDIQELVTIDPETIARRLYSRSLITRGTLEYVTNTYGVSNNPKADKLTQDCGKIIINDADPEAKLKAMLDVLKSGDIPPGSDVVQRIEQVCDFVIVITCKSTLPPPLSLSLSLYLSFLMPC